MGNEHNSINIIFDMDGTLVDSAKITIPAFAKVCPEFDLPIPDDETIMSAIGYANPFFYYKIFPNINKEKLLEFGLKVERVEREIVTSINAEMLFDGIKELLETLKKRKYKMYIASTGGPKHVDTCLKGCNIYSYFEEIYCNKPDKELMVKKIIKKAPSGIWIMIGDRTKDSKAAKHNGITSIGAAYGYCVPKDYDKFDYICNKPYDLIQLIEGIQCSRAK